MTIKELQKGIDTLIPVLQKQIDTHDTKDTIEGRDELQQIIGQLQMLNYLKNLIKK
jgi:hypothetical protein